MEGGGTGQMIYKCAHPKCMYVRSKLAQVRFHFHGRVANTAAAASCDIIKMAADARSK